VRTAAAARVLLAALSVSGAIFLILELDQPFDGVIQILPALQCATLLRISAASSGKFLLRFQKSQRPVLGDFFCISEFCLSSLQIIAFCNLDLSISVCF